jgi:hypothetical protein
MPIGSINEPKAIDIGFYHRKFSLTVQRRHCMRLRPAAPEPGGDLRVSSRGQSRLVCRTIGGGLGFDPR